MARNYFFITGLPRSRSAWLANWMTDKHSYCFHELAKYGKDCYELNMVMKKRGEVTVGTADSSFPYYYKQFMQYIPGKIVVVERDPADVIESYEEDFETDMPPGLIDECLEKLENNQKDPRNFDCPV